MSKVIVDRDLTRQVNIIGKKQMRKKRWQRFVSVLCAFTVFCTTYALILPAITINKDSLPIYYCGLVEHIHNETCYQSVLNCKHGEEERAPSGEDAVSVDEQYRSKLPADLNGDDAEKLLAVAVSQLGYSESDTDKVNDVIYDDDGNIAETIYRGSTYFGEYFGNAFGEWNNAFAAYCLNYAGITGFAENESVSASDIADHFVSVEKLFPAVSGNGYVPAPGDVVFFDFDKRGEDEDSYFYTSAENENGEAAKVFNTSVVDGVAFVYEIAESETESNGEEGDTAKELQLVVIVGDMNDKVEKAYCALDDVHIVAYASVGDKEENENGESSEAAGESEKDSGVSEEPTFDVIGDFEVPAEESVVRASDDGGVETDPAGENDSSAASVDVQSDAPVENDVSGEDGEPAVQSHVHTEECYEKILICGKSEHKHTHECEVPREHSEDDSWKSELPELTGIRRDDIVAVAASQIGYTESTDDIATVNNTVNGYSRYGAWYGSPYEDWNTIFVSFVLSHAGVERSEIEYFKNAAVLASTLDASGRVHLAGFESDMFPQPGDILLLAPELGEVTVTPVTLDTADDEKADFVAKADEPVIKAAVGQPRSEALASVGRTAVFAGYIVDPDLQIIRGMRVIEGDVDGTVSNRIYELTDPRVLGFVDVSERAVVTRSVLKRAPLRLLGAGDTNISVAGFKATIRYGATLTNGDWVKTVTDNHADQRFTIRVSYSLSGTYEFKPGEIEIRIPASILLDRNGLSKDYYEMSVLHRDDPRLVDGDNNNYVYYEDPATKEIVIYNRQEVPAGQSAFFEVSYLTSEKTYEYADYQSGNPYAASKEFAARITAKQGNVEVKADSEKFPVYINTDAKIFSVGKSVPTEMYTSWDSSWGTAPADADQYNYLIWEIRSIIENTTQPYNLTLEDTMANRDCEVYGFLTQEAAKNTTVYTPATDGKVVISNLKSDYKYGRYDYVLTRHLKSTWNPERTVNADSTYSYTLTNRVKATVHPVDGVDPDTFANASRSWTYEEHHFQHPPGHYYLWKWGLDGKNDIVDDSDDVRNWDLSEFLNTMKQPAYGDMTSLSDLKYYTFFHGYNYPWTLPLNMSQEAIGDIINGLVFDAGGLEELNRNAPQILNKYYRTNTVTYVLEDDMFYLNTILDGSGDVVTYPTNSTFDSEGRIGLASNLGTQLLPGDYQIDSITVTSQYQDAVFDTEKLAFSATEPVYKPNDKIAIYVKTNVRTGSIANVQRNAANNGFIGPVAEYDPATKEILIKDRRYVRAVDGATVYFYNGVTGFRLETTTDHYYTNIGAYPSITLFNTNHVKSMVQEIIQKPSSQQKIRIANQAQAYALEDRVSAPNKAITGFNKIGFEYAAGKVRHSDIEKKSIGYYNDAFNRQFHYTWSVRMNESFLATGNRRVYVPQSSGIFYDLLPGGATLNTSSIKVYADGVMLELGEYEIETQPNFRGTGRTMLIVRLKKPSEKEYYFTYETVHSWDDITDYGSTIKNSVAYETGNDDIGDGSRDTGYPPPPDEDISNDTRLVTISEADLMANLHYGGTTPVSSRLPKFIYTECKHENGLPVFATMGLDKKIRSEDESFYTYVSKTTPRGEYYYRLRYATDDFSEAKNLILYDSLENYVVKIEGEGDRTSEWHGTLVDIDLSYLKNQLGIAPVVYISTMENMTFNTYAVEGADLNFGDPAWGNLNIANSTVWRNAMNPDGTVNTALLPLAKAIAIDMRRKADGTEFVLPTGSAVNATLIMKASRPLANAVSRYYPDETDPVTYNNVWLAGTIYDIYTKKAETKSIHQDYTKISFHTVNPGIELRKLDNKTGAAVSGVVFRLYGRSVWATGTGDDVDITGTTGSDGTLVFSKLEPGEYTLQEVTANSDDYFENHVGMRVVVEGTGKVTIYDNQSTITPPHRPRLELVREDEDYYIVYNIYNDPRIHADFEFLKYGSIDGSDYVRELTGVRFRLHGVSDYGNEITMYASSVQGRVSFRNIEKGKYEMLEISTRSDYVLSNTVYTVVVDGLGMVTVSYTVTNPDGSESTVELPVNSSSGTHEILNEPLHSFRIRKSDSIIPENGVAGAVFNLKGVTNEGVPYDNDFRTDGYGLIVAGIPSGSYVLVETEAPQGFALDPTPRLVKITRDGVITIDGAVLTEDGFYEGYWGITNDESRDGFIDILKIWDDNGASNRPTPSVVIIGEIPEQPVKEATLINDRSFSTYEDLYGWANFNFNGVNYGNIKRVAGFSNKQAYITDKDGNRYPTKFEYIDNTDPNNPKTFYISLTALFGANVVGFYNSWYEYREHVPGVADKFEKWPGNSGALNYVTVEEMLAEHPDAVRVDDGTGDGRIYAWLDEPNKTVYWWSDAHPEHIYLPENCRYLFAFTDIENLDLSYFNASRTVSLEKMFLGAHIPALNLDGWDVSNVTDMSEMFAVDYTLMSRIDDKFEGTWVWYDNKYKSQYNTDSGEFGYIDLSSWTSPVSLKYADSMFYGTSAAYLLLPEVWEPSGLVSMQMFLCSSDFGRIGAVPGVLDLTNWGSLSNLKSARAAFAMLGNINEIKLSDWNVGGAGFDASGMFYGSVNGGAPLTTGDATLYIKSGSSAPVTSITLGNMGFVNNATYMFRNDCSGSVGFIGSTLDISGIDFSLCTSFRGMFFGCSNLNSLIGLNAMNVSNATNFSGMFGKTGFTSLDLTAFENSKVTDLNTMFADSSKLTTVQFDPAKFKTSKVTNMGEMFARCVLLQSISGIESFDTSKCTNLAAMFSGCVDLSKVGTANNVIDLSRWNVEKVTNCARMFNGTGQKISGQLEFDLSGWKTSSLIYVYEMFMGLNNTYPTARRIIYVDSTRWDMTLVINPPPPIVNNATDMFTNCGGLRNFDSYIVDYRNANTTSTGYLTHRSFTGTYNVQSVNAPLLSQMMSGSAELGLHYAELNVKHYNDGAGNTATGIELRTYSAIYTGTNPAEARDAWVKDGNKWYYRMSLYDFERTYYMYESPLPGYTTNHGIDNPIMIKYIPSRVTAEGHTLHAEITYYIDKNEGREGTSPEWEVVARAVHVPADNDPNRLLWSLPMRDPGTGSVIFDAEGDPVWGDNQAEIPDVIGITNTKSDDGKGSFALTKKVSGNDLSYADINRKYTFRVRLWDASGRELSDVYGGVMFINGAADISLSPGETWYCTGLPVGARYTITELDAQGFDVSVKVNGVVKSSASDLPQQTLADTATHYVEFENKKDRKQGELKITKTVVPEEGSSLDDVDTARQFAVDVTFFKKLTLNEAGVPDLSIIYAGDNWSDSERAEWQTRLDTARNAIPADENDPTYYEKYAAYLLVYQEYVAAYRATAEAKSIVAEDLNGVYGSTLISNGKARVFVRHGEEILITGLPADLLYFVEEESYPQYDVSYTGNTSGDNNHGRIVNGAEKLVGITNTKKDVPTGGFKLKKLVPDGISGDKFTFHIDFSNLEPNTTYSYTYLLNGSDSEFEIPLVRNTLRSDGQGYITGLTPGADYTLAVTRVYSDALTDENGVVDLSALGVTYTPYRENQIVYLDSGDGVTTLPPVYIDTDNHAKVYTGVQNANVKLFRYMPVGGIASNATSGKEYNWNIGVDTQTGITSEGLPYGPEYFFSTYLAATTRFSSSVVSESNGKVFYKLTGGTLSNRIIYVFEYLTFTADSSGTIPGFVSDKNVVCVDGACIDDRGYVINQIPNMQFSLKRVSKTDPNDVQIDTGYFTDENGLLRRRALATAIVSISELNLRDYDYYLTASGFTFTSGPYGSASVSVTLNPGDTIEFKGLPATIPLESAIDKTADVNGTVTGLAPRTEYAVYRLMSDNSYMRTGTVTSNANGVIGGLVAGDTYKFARVGARYLVTEAASGYVASYVITNDGTGGEETINKPAGSNLQIETPLSTGTEIVDAGEDITVTYTNDRKRFRTAFAKSTPDGEFVVGAHLAIYEAAEYNAAGGNHAGLTPVISWQSGSTVEYVTLPAGDFVLVETQTPDDTYQPADPVFFTITPEGRIASGSDEYVYLITMLNEPIHIRVDKVDDFGKKVPGAGLKITEYGSYSEEGGDYTVTKNAAERDVFTWTSSDSPRYIGGVFELNKIYHLFEHFVPEGYEKAEDVYFIFTRDNEEDPYNYRIIELDDLTTPTTFTVAPALPDSIGENADLLEVEDKRKPYAVFRKVDDRGLFVKGAGLELYEYGSIGSDGIVTESATSGTPIYSWTSDGTALTINEEVIGREFKTNTLYRIHEVSVPAGWKLADDVWFYVDKTSGGFVVLTGSGVVQTGSAVLTKGSVSVMDQYQYTYVQNNYENVGSTALWTDIENGEFELTYYARAGSSGLPAFAQIQFPPSYNVTVTDVRCYYSPTADYSGTLLNDWNDYITNFMMSRRTDEYRITNASYVVNRADGGQDRVYVGFYTGADDTWRTADYDVQLVVKGKWDCNSSSATDAFNAGFVKFTSSGYNWCDSLNKDSSSVKSNYSQSGYSQITLNNSNGGKNKLGRVVEGGVVVYTPSATGGDVIKLKPGYTTLAGAVDTFEMIDEYDNHIVIDKIDDFSEKVSGAELEIYVEGAYNNYGIVQPPSTALDKPIYAWTTDGAEKMILHTDVRDFINDPANGWTEAQKAALAEFGGVFGRDNENTVIYRLHEKSAPAGYTAADDILFIVTSDGFIRQVVTEQKTSPSFTVTADENGVIRDFNIVSGVTYTLDPVVSEGRPDLFTGTRTINIPYPLPNGSTSSSPINSTILNSDTIGFKDENGNVWFNRDLTYHVKLRDEYITFDHTVTSTSDSWQKGFQSFAWYLIENKQTGASKETRAPYDGEISTSAYFTSIGGIGDYKITMLEGRENSTSREFDATGALLMSSSGSTFGARLYLQRNSDYEFSVVGMQQYTVTAETDGELSGFGAGFAYTAGETAYKTVRIITRSADKLEMVDKKNPNIEVEKRWLDANGNIIAPVSNETKLRLQWRAEFPLPDTDELSATGELGSFYSFSASDVAVDEIAGRFTFIKAGNRIGLSSDDEDPELNKFVGVLLARDNVSRPVGDTVSVMSLVGHDSNGESYCVMIPPANTVAEAMNSLYFSENSVPQAYVGNVNTFAVSHDSSQMQLYDINGNFVATADLSGIHAGQLENLRDGKSLDGYPSGCVVLNGIHVFDQLSGIYIGTADVQSDDEYTVSVDWADYGTGPLVTKGAAFVRSDGTTVSMPDDTSLIDAAQLDPVLMSPVTLNSSDPEHTWEVLRYWTYFETTMPVGYPVPEKAVIEYRLVDSAGNMIASTAGEEKTSLTAAVTVGADPRAGFTATVKLQQAYVFYVGVPYGRVLLDTRNFVLPDDYESDKITLDLQYGNGESAVGKQVEAYRVELYGVTYFVFPWEDYGTPQTLNTSNNFKYHWSDLPGSIPADKVPTGYLAYSPIYRVVETGYSAGGRPFDSTTDHEGLTIGSVLLTNSETDYELPESGGIGTSMYTMMGSLLLLVSSAGYLLYRQKKRKEVPKRE